MTRLPDWPERLAAMVEARRNQPFAWGEQDCCMFAADCAQALTGRDPAALWRGRYATEAEAEAFLAPGGGLEGTVAAAMALFGAEEVPPLMAGRGDWALVLVGNQMLVGVVLGGLIATTGDDGLAFVPLRRAIRAWRI